ncbi:uncharacterized protein LOC109600265 [Aethina tumida]|uniref:uncharacterized protein LOC109600265 n=1 Tax=Aethina tumida TaxID=116153 RepID=UPI0021480252|nr:uncharacterized protein LOC109600265 [Aethina tumida]
MKRRRSTIWDFFQQSGDDGAKCLYCSVVLSTKGGSTGNLTRHLRVKHPQYSHSSLANFEIPQVEITEQENSVVPEEYEEPEPTDNKQALHDELMLYKRFKNENENEYDTIAKVWSSELQKMSNDQQIYAKKAINEILYEGQLGNLTRNSIQFNIFSEQTSSTVNN